MIPKQIHQIHIGPNELPAREAAWCAQMQRMNAKTWAYELHGNELLDKYGKDPYVKHMLDRKSKWAFITDRLRVLLLAETGGIYLDTDCQPIKPLDTLKVWDDAGVDFVYGMRNPYRPGVALHRGVGFCDNTVMASAPQSAMVRRLMALWRPEEIEVTGHRVGLAILSHADVSCRGLGFRYFYNLSQTPEAIVLHDGHNTGSWVGEHRQVPVINKGEFLKV